MPLLTRQLAQMDTDSTVPTAAAKVVGDFRLGRQLGSGGFGTVYEAEHIKTRLPYAVKRLHAEEPERFEKEALYPARAASRSLHVLNIHSFFQGPEGEFYLVTDLIPYGDLGAFVKEHRPLSVDAALQIAGGIAKGLAAIHEHGIVHLDLKPANVLMDFKDEQWIPKIADFGLARSTMSQAMNQCGSVGYASPEHFDSRLARGPASDMFSFGMLLFELLTGQRACGDATSMTEYASWILRATPPPAPSTLRAELRSRGDIDRIIGDLLQFDASRRTLSAGMATRRLADARTSLIAEPATATAALPEEPPVPKVRPAPEGRPAPRPEPRIEARPRARNPRAVIAVVALLVISGGIAAFVLFGGNQEVDASEGMTKFRAGAYAQAFPRLLDDARAGNVEAQRAIGQMYAKGLGVPKNVIESRMWLDKAVAQDDAEAKCALADLSREGDDLTKAGSLYTEAANTHACGHAGIGQLLTGGPRGPRDFDEGLHHLEVAADMGDVTSATRIRELQADWMLVPLVQGVWQPVVGRERRDELGRLKAERMLDQLQLVDLRRLRRLDVEFYAGTALFELEAGRLADGLGVVTYLRRADGVVLVNGRPEQIYRLNATAPVLIDTPQRAAAFLRFFQAGAVQGRNGMFRIVEESKDLQWLESAPPAVRTGAGQALQPLRIEMNPSGGWQASGTVTYGRGLLKASFWVKPDGTVVPTDREEIDSQLPVREEFFDINGVRRARAAFDPRLPR